MGEFCDHFCDHGEGEVNFLDRKERKRIRACLERHEDMIGCEFSYAQFVKMLNLTRYSDRGKKEKQLESLGEFINFEILENGKILLHGAQVERNGDVVEETVKAEDAVGDVNDSERGTCLELSGKFMTVKDFYNEERGKKPTIEFRSIVKTSLMGLISQNLYNSRYMVYRAGYDEIAEALGFCNGLFRSVRRQYIKSTQIINGVSGRPKRILGRQTKRAIDAIRDSYVGYINRTLEILQKEGYINFSVNYWGYRDNELTKSNEIVPLTEEEELFCNIEGKEIVYKQMGVNGYGKIRYLNKETEFYERLGRLLKDRFGLSFVRRMVEVVLTDKGKEDRKSVV